MAEILCAAGVSLFTVVFTVRCIFAKKVQGDYVCLRQNQVLKCFILRQIPLMSCIGGTIDCSQEKTLALVNKPWNTVGFFLSCLVFIPVVFLFKHNAMANENT